MIVLNTNFMAAKTPITLIYSDIVNALSNVIESKYIFFGRPNVSKDGDCPMKKFVSIELPVGIEDYAAGKKKWMLVTSGVVFLFVKTKKDNTMNLSTTSDFIDNVVKLFPINGTVCSASGPRVLLSGADEYGYQVTSITFDLQTKVNVFN